MIKGKNIKWKKVPPGQLLGNDASLQQVPKPCVENVETICLMSLPPMENCLLAILVDAEVFFFNICKSHLRCRMLTRKINIKENAQFYFLSIVLLKLD